MNPLALFKAAAALSAVLATAGPATRADGQSLPGPYPAQVERVIDGDSLGVRVTIWIGQELTTIVRLRTADTPELNALCREARETAERAKAFVESRAGGRTVALRNVETDKYGGRVAADVMLDDTSLADLLIAEGLAKPYAERRPDWCPKAASRVE
jgi:micrococcal nuclease